MNRLVVGTKGFTGCARFNSKDANNWAVYVGKAVSCTHSLGKTLVQVQATRGTGLFWWRQGQIPQVTVLTARGPL